jgi:hypothetical protein
LLVLLLLLLLQLLEHVLLLLLHVRHLLLHRGSRSSRGLGRSGGGRGGFWRQTRVKV